MSVQEYYLIKYAAEKDKGKGNSVLNKLLGSGDPAEASLAIGKSQRKPEKRIWSLLKWLPGVAPGKELYDEYKDTKTSWDTLSKELGKDEKGKSLLSRLGKLREAYIGKPSLTGVGRWRTKAVQHGLPALAGIGGATYGVLKSMKKNKKEQKEYDDLVNSEAFQQLPPEVQKAIMEHGYKKQNRGFFKRMMRNAKYGLGYGLGAQMAVKPLAYQASWIPYLQSRSMVTSTDGYKNQVDSFKRDLAAYMDNQVNPFKRDLAAYMGGR